MRLRFGWLLSATVLCVACAEGGSMMDGGSGADTGPVITTDGGGGRDSGPAACPSGQHRCGGGCIDDLANDPAVGCRLGCGEACPTPPDGVAACDGDGMCTFGCEPPFSLVGGECVCAPRTCADMGYMCGAPDDGCGTSLDCGTCDGGGVCTDGTCSCPMDTLEPNDSRLSVTTDLVRIGDVNDWDMTYTMWTLDEADDVDWIRFHVEDTGLDNPDIQVTLDNIPSGSNYDLAAYYVCDSGGENSGCTSGMPDNSVGNGCASASSGTTSETVEIAADCSNGLSSNDSGTLWIRVTSSTFGGSCAAYRLRVHITS